MIEIVYVLGKAQHLRKRAKALFALALFLKLRMYLRDLFRQHLDCTTAPLSQLSKAR